MISIDMRQTMLVASASLRWTFPTSIWPKDGRPGRREAMPNDDTSRRGLTTTRAKASICYQMGQCRELQLEGTMSRAMARGNNAKTNERWCEMQRQRQRRRGMQGGGRRGMQGGERMTVIVFYFFIPRHPHVINSEKLMKY
jgi:hypothetical protein